MKIYVLRLVFSLILLGTSVTLLAAPSPTQDLYESSISAVVRNKYYYKPGRLEFTLTAGAMPYDSLINHFMVGGHAEWHITDHFGWEVVDFQWAFPSVTSYTTGIVKSYGISHLEAVKMKQLVSSNIVISPLYGKIRFVGRQVLYFDIYAVVGGGAANTDVLNFSSASTGTEPVQSILRSGWDPMFDIGFGFKVFLNDAMGLVIDLRDYIVDSRTYGSNGLKNNYSVFAGLSFFLPTF